MPTSVFLSCVSTEFKSYRELLAQQLESAGVKVYTQETFRDAGGRLLEHLSEYIQKSQQVIHLIGRGVGIRPEPDELNVFLNMRGDLIAKPALGE
jgi:hypothetical protein